MLTKLAAMSLTLRASHFLGLRSIAWEIPAGVSALVGPNGAGKTTLLRLPLFMKYALEQGIGNAAAAFGGPATLRHFDASADDPTEIELSVGDVGWRLRLLPTPTTIECQDVLLVNGSERMRREPFAPTAFMGTDAHPVDTRNGGPGLRAVVSQRVPGWEVAGDVVEALRRWTLFEAYSYQLPTLRNGAQMAAADQQLSPRGDNAFTVLRNWRDARATRQRWDFVVGGLNELFPDLFEDIEFQAVNNQLFGRFVRPGGREAVPTYLAPNGWLVGLCHLCAVASAEPGGVVAIDEPENALHPFALRRFVEVTRRWCERIGCSVVLATHSPVLINTFEGQPDRLFVMQPGRHELPVRLDELRAPEWLTNFALGDLFMHEEFGGPALP